MSAYIQILYLSLFLITSLCLYFVVKKSYRYIVLLILSLFFSFLISSYMVAFIILTSIIIYFLGRWMGRIYDDLKIKKENLEKEEYKRLKKLTKKKTKRILILGIILTLSILIGLKYINLFISGFNLIFKSDASLLKIILPIGISYYTLSSIGYLVDIYYERYICEKNYFKILLFVSFFPSLLEGPISWYGELKPTLLEGSDFSFDNLIKGLERFIFGLFKKLVIADRLAILVGAVFNNSNVAGYAIIFGIIAFTLQLYAEFSGIIDMVSGVSEALGIRLAKNFDQPFFSKSVGEFWRRWHISLGRWFKDYVFYPLSMTKLNITLTKKLKNKLSPFWSTFIPMQLALFVVWSLTGLWHGASLKYLVYGIYYFIIMAVEAIIFNYLKNTKFVNSYWYKAFALIKVFVFVNLGMLIFKVDNLALAFKMLCSIFKSSNFNILKVFSFKEIIVSIVSLGLLFIISLMKEKKIDIFYHLHKNFFLHCAIMIAFIMFIIIFGAYGNGYLPPDPIYGGF